ncbi:MAG: GNAT family N-acetyltransferase [Gammaproteobacteria bacterium]
MSNILPGPMVRLDGDLDVAIREDDESGLIRNISINERVFGIRLADTERGRSEASLLISRMYATRGYQVTSPLVYGPNRITLTAACDGVTMGTVTLGIDSPMGILADEIFKGEIDTFRTRGGRVCEITKFAVDPQMRSKHALAALFHTLFIYARYLYGCTDMFIEVNPRHRRFYENMLGFRQLGELRENPRVHAPAYLLRLCLNEAAKHIELHGDTSDNPGKDRSLYPYFFSKKEEEGIAHRLFNITWAPEQKAQQHVAQRRYG